MSTEVGNRGTPPAGAPWWRRHLPALVVALIAVVVGALIQAIFLDEDPQSPAPLGTIDSPQRAATVAPQAQAAGRLRDIPGGRHVWLAARRGPRQWATAREIPHDPTWQTGIPGRAPPGQPLELVLFTVGSDGDERLRTAAGSELGVNDVPGTRILAKVPTFYVKKAAPPVRLHAVFPQARDSGGKAFRFENAGGELDATFPDDPACRRPEQAVGLRLAWDMSGKENGGWGVLWRHAGAPAGRFDASAFDQLSFSVRGKEGGETFEIGLKDISGKETKVPVGAVGADRWTELVVPLDKFKGVNTESIENFNFGFNVLHGAGTLCVDEIAFE